MSTDVWLIFSIGLTRNINRAAREILNAAFLDLGPRLATRYTTHLISTKSSKKWFYQYEFVDFAKRYLSRPWIWKKKLQWFLWRLCVSWTCIKTLGIGAFDIACVLSSLCHERYKLLCGGWDFRFVLRIAKEWYFAGDAGRRE